MNIRKASTIIFCLCLIILSFGPTKLRAEQLKVGTWKTAQTIQPFFYQDFLEKNDTVTVFSFTNPADQKTALLAGSLDMTGTTLAHAIQSAVMGQPVVVVAALCNKASALVVRQARRRQFRLCPCWRQLWRRHALASSPRASRSS